MKIAVTATSASLDAEVDPRLGRAATFVVYDTDTDDWTVLDNTQNLQAAQGAGIQSTQNLVREGVQAVLTGHCGPNAYRVLSSANIALYTDVSGTVQEAVQAFKAGELNSASAPDVQGHW